MLVSLSKTLYPLLNSIGSTQELAGRQSTPQHDKKNCCCFRERSGSVVEWLTRDRGAVGLTSLTGVTALWSLSKTHLS